MHVLVIEDSEKMATILGRGLREEGHETVIVHTGRSGLEQLQCTAPDAVVLDLGLPDIDGIEVIEQVRDQQSRVPILVLTARDAINSRVQALDAGADDYLVKPFAFEELLARLSALVRRATSPRWSPLSLGDVRLDPNMQAALITGEDARPLSPREFSLLEALMQKSGEIVSRKSLLQDAFGYAFDPGTNLLDVHLSHLRKKLAGTSIEIRTVRGAGFVLEQRKSR